MSRRENLLALAERVESASGPDRELDCSIGRALGYRPEWPEAEQTSSPWAFSPIYTASLDAAMTLVPEGFMWRLQSWPDGVNSAILERGAGDFGAIDARHTETFAVTPALALAAAALRARAANGGTA